MQRLFFAFAIAFLLAGCRADNPTDGGTPGGGGPIEPPLVTWESLSDGLSAGPVTLLQANSFGDFASIRTGLVRLDGSGVSWVPTALTTGVLVLDLIADPGLGFLFARDGSNKVYRSPNGTAWDELTLPGAALGLARGDDGVIVALGRNSVYRSSDGGETWTVEAPAGLDFEVGITLFTSVEVSGSRLFLASAQTGGLFYSGDARQWARVSALDGLSITAAAVSPDGIVYVAPANGPIYRSANAGQTWAATGTEGLERADERRTALATNSAGHIFLATSGDGLYRSTDRGDIWESFQGAPADNTPRLDDRLLALAVDARDFLLVASDQGRVFVSGSPTTSNK